MEPSLDWYPQSAELNGRSTAGASNTAGAFAAGALAAGPLAASAASSRWGRGAFHLPKPHSAKPSSGKLPSGKPNTRGQNTRSRSRSFRRTGLASVLLYGVVPLVVVGAIVAAFVLVSSGHSTAAASFKTGKAPAAQSATVIDPPTSASPSASAIKHPKHHPSAKASPSAIVKVSTPAAKPKPKRKKSSGTASAPVPRDLGQPNFDGYCEHIGSGAAEVTADNAYGWHCVRNSSQVLALSAVCSYTYHLSSSQVIGVSSNYYDADDWQCWQATEDLGVVNFTAYCTGAGLGTSELVADNAYGWYCTSPSAPVNTTAACQAVYHVSSVVARFALFSDPYSWQCWV